MNVIAVVVAVVIQKRRWDVFRVLTVISVEVRHLLK